MSQWTCQIDGACKHNHMLILQHMVIILQRSRSLPKEDWLTNVEIGNAVCTEWYARAATYPVVCAGNA